MHSNSYGLFKCTGFALLICLLSCQRGPEFNISQVKAVSKLATVEFIMSKTVYGHKDGKIPLIPVKFNRASFMAFTEVRIKAGIDLDKLREDDIKIDGQKVRLRLPAIEILNFSYPAEGFIEDTLYTDQTKFLNQITIEDQEHLFRQADQHIRKQIPDLGIEETAQKNARLLLTSLLSEMGFEEIYIEFHPSKDLNAKTNFSSDKTE